MHNGDFLILKILHYYYIFLISEYIILNKETEKLNIHTDSVLLLKRSDHVLFITSESKLQS